MSFRAVLEVVPEDGKVSTHMHTFFSRVVVQKSTISTYTKWRYRSNDSLVSILQVVVSSEAQAASGDHN